jgi:hypothetical protein
MVFYDDLGFATNYTVDANLEYPGDGKWDYPERRVFKPGSDLVGGPQALIRPTDADAWLLVTGFTGLGALYATPDPDLICVFEQFDRVVLVKVFDPSIQMALDGLYPVRIAGSVNQGLLLVGDWTDITAVGLDGVRWRSGRLVLDDLHITRSDGDRIYYRGENFDGSSELRGSLDARTGETVG